MKMNKSSLFSSTILLWLLLSCSQSETKLLGNDVRLFKNSPVWEVAKAIEADDTTEIKQLLHLLPDSLINYQEKRFGQSLLEWAVYTDHYPSVKVLAELGANPNLQSKNGTSPIIEAANKYNDSRYLILLLNHGGNPNDVADVDEPQHLRTPLMAAAYNSLQNVKLLIEAGADPSYVHTAYGIQNALKYAFEGDKIDIVKYLLMDVGVDYKRAMGVTIGGDSLYVTNFLREMPFPLESKEYNQKMEVVNFLKEKGVDYFKVPIPKHYYNNYDSEYLKKY